MSSTLADMQKIIVTLSEPNLEIEPGSFAQLTVTMINRQESADRLLLEIEGIDVEWYGIPVPAVNLEAGGQAEANINFRIGRNTENRAGAYPFLVRVRAMETGAVGIAQATLNMKPFSSLQVELSPKRGIATFLRPVNEFMLNLAHQGNQEESFDLSASDADDGCTYEFDQERVTLQPGQTAQVPFFIRPKTSSVVGGGQLYGFSVYVRSNPSAHVLANVHGQLERRSLISPLMGVFLLLLTMISFGAWYLWPRPLQPLKIHSFTALPLQVMQGGTVTLSWDVQPNYDQIILSRRQGDQVPINESVQPKEAVGSVIVTPLPPQTTYVLEVRRNNGTSKKLEVTIDVTTPPPSPKPSISYFKVEPDKIHEGESVLLSWKTAGATRTLLDPGSMEIPPYEHTRNIPLDKDTAFTLRVIGQNPQDFVEKTIKVTAAPKDTCIAEILSLGIDRKTVYEGDKVKVVWQTRYAKTVTLDYDKGSLGEMPRKSGSIELPMPIKEPITLTLKAVDSLGNSIAQQLVITPQPRPVTPPEGTTPDPSKPGENQTGTNPPPPTNNGQ